MPSEAITDLVKQRARFLQFISRRIEDRAAAEDLLQSAYARAISQWEALRIDDSANAWFYRILRNAIIDYYRHCAVEDRVVEPLSRETVTSVPSQDSTICHCISDAINNVKPAYGEILRQVELADNSSASLEAFAKKSGITRGNAAVRAHRARRALRKQLLQRCGKCAQAGCLECTCI